MLFAGYTRGRGWLVNKGGTSQIGRRRMELQGFQSFGSNSGSKVTGRRRENYDSIAVRDGGLLIRDDGAEQSPMELFR